MCLGMRVCVWYVFMLISVLYGYQTVPVAFPPVIFGVATLIPCQQQLLHKNYLNITLAKQGRLVLVRDHFSLLQASSVSSLPPSNLHVFITSKTVTKTLRHSLRFMVVQVWNLDLGSRHTQLVHEFSVRKAFRSQQSPLRAN